MEIILIDILDEVQPCLVNWWNDVFINVIEDHPFTCWHISVQAILDCHHLTVVPQLWDWAHQQWLGHDSEEPSLLVIFYRLAKLCPISHINGHVLTAQYFGHLHKLYKSVIWNCTKQGWHTLGNTEPLLMRSCVLYRDSCCQFWVWNLSLSYKYWAHNALHSSRHLTRKHIRCKWFAMVFTQQVDISWHTVVCTLYEEKARQLVFYFLPHCILLLCKSKHPDIGTIVFVVKIIPPGVPKCWVDVHSVCDIVKNKLMWGRLTSTWQLSVRHVLPCYIVHCAVLVK